MGWIKLYKTILHRVSHILHFGATRDQTVAKKWIVWWLRPEIDRRKDNTVYRNRFMVWTKLDKPILHRVPHILHSGAARDRTVANRWAVCWLRPETDRRTKWFIETASSFEPNYIKIYYTGCPIFCVLEPLDTKQLLIDEPFGGSANRQTKERTKWFIETD